MDFKKTDDIKKTITFLLENGEFADIETAYNISMNALNGSRRSFSPVPSPESVL